MTIGYELPSLVDPDQRAAVPRTPAPEKATVVLSRAETADCTCPDFCERDHDVD